MAESDHLASMFPAFAARVRKIPLADLPTPVRGARLEHAGRASYIWLKLDNRSSALYGGNKVRKLEYLLCPTTRKTVRRFATFGTVGSHHALATAMHAINLGYACTCFLAHQHRIPSIARTLNMHLALGTEIVRYGGAYATRISSLRQHLWHRDAWVIPAGGSSWSGTLGFVNAGLELAAQIGAGQIPVPGRLYVASGTLGTAAGLALGLALSGLPTEVQAVRVSHSTIANQDVLNRLLHKTVTMMRHFGATVPADLAERVRIRFRHAFFAGGYAHSDTSTEEAIRLAREQLDLQLESTYTGKAMAALLEDLRTGDAGEAALFWNTYNSAPLPAGACAPADVAALPPEFLRYFS